MQIYLTVRRRGVGTHLHPLLHLNPLHSCRFGASPMGLSTHVWWWAKVLNPQLSYSYMGSSHIIFSLIGFMWCFGATTILLQGNLVFFSRCLLVVILVLGLYPRSLGLALFGLFSIGSWFDFGSLSILGSVSNQALF